MGQALSYWEQLEEHLATIFALLIGLNEPSAAAVRAFGAIATNRGRMDMLAAAAEVYFADHPDPALQTSFNQLAVAVSGYAARRNEIAHGIVRHTSRAEPEYLLFSPFYNTNKMAWGTGSVYAYTSSDIFHFLVGFLNLSIAAHQFSVRFEARSEARRAYGGMLSPEQIEELDRLLLDPTDLTHRRRSQLREAAARWKTRRRPRKRK